MQVVLGLLAVALYLFGLIDVIRSDPDERVGLPKAFWIIVVALFPALGALVWLIVSRFARVNTAVDDYRRHTGQAPKPDRPAPDDDPDFLAALRRNRKPPADPEDPVHR